MKSIWEDESLVEDVVDCVFFANPCLYEERKQEYYFSKKTRYVSISPFDDYTEKDGYLYYYLGRGLKDIFLTLEYKIDLSKGTSSEGEWTPKESPYKGPVVCFSYGEG